MRGKGGVEVEIKTSSGVPEAAKRSQLVMGKRLGESKMLEEEENPSAKR